MHDRFDRKNTSANSHLDYIEVFGSYGNFHYSNPESQGVTIKQTDGYPIKYDDKLMDCHSAYSDRLQQWDYAHFKQLCADFFDAKGDQAWTRTFQSMSDQRLREFAQAAFKLDRLPEHVRTTYRYNVASGYDCPSIEVICSKVKPKSELRNVDLQSEYKFV